MPVLQLAVLFGILGPDDFGVTKNKSLETSTIPNYDYDSLQFCETPTCAEESSRIFENMNINVDPCDNFYKFACGRGSDRFVTFVPEGRTSIGTFTDLEATLENQILRLISDGIKDDRPVFESMKNYYQACMDIDQTENSENELLEVLKELGGCPLLDGPSWDESRLGLNASIHESIKKSLAKISIEIDPKNSSKHIITIDRTEPELPREDLIQGKDNDNVKDHLLALIEIVGFLGVDAENAEKELSDVIDFQIKLAKISLSDEDRQNRSKLNNRMTLRELNNNYPIINWREFINHTLGSYIELDSSEEIILADTSYFKSLQELRPTIPLRVLANYACVREIWELSDSLGERFLSTKINSVKAYSTQIEEPRWKYCLKKLSERFTTAVGWLYVRNYFDKSTKEKVAELLTYLYDALITLIDSADWMDDSSRLRTMDKLMYMKAYIGYPDEFDDDEKINEVYQNLSLFNSSSFLKSDITLKEFNQKRKYLSLRKSVNETSWIDHSNVAMANAYYSHKTNTYVLPAGILQGEFFSRDKPNYLNYGAIGSFVGHEMSHSFDEQGSQYDEKGNLVNWWTNERREKYLEKSKCFIEQYNNYYVKQVGRNINGTRTKNENIADNLGLKAAYLAYSHWVRVNGKEPLLPHFTYTPEQMFWISFANAWCTRYEPHYLTLLLQSHSTSEARVIGTLSNIQAFSDDFDCPVGSPMNPAKKCKIF